MAWGVKDMIAGMEMRWEVGREVGDGRGCGAEKGWEIGRDRSVIWCVGSMHSPRVDCRWVRASGWYLVLRACTRRFKI